MRQHGSIVNNRKEVFRVSLFSAAIAGFRDPERNNPSGDSRGLGHAPEGFAALRSDNGRAVRKGGPSHIGGRIFFQPPLRATVKQSSLEPQAQACFRRSRQAEAIGRTCHAYPVRKNWWVISDRWATFIDVHNDRVRLIADLPEQARDRLIMTLSRRSPNSSGAATNGLKPPFARSRLTGCEL
jgi:hypothetical protein